MSIGVLSLRFVKEAVLCREEAGGNSGLLHKEMRMSKEDDFFGDFNESPDDMETGQEDTSEPLREESPAETEPAPPSQQPARPTARSHLLPTPRQSRHW